ncbi:hypothetical protein X727_21245 [Mesorhizobium sp. L103C119B0]|nr:hypothetical protein X771_09220 [Mesorhizobium sp. LSJC277A00]ESX12610.1 hypothetical protein X766_30220 [Mesorhizobium sp. LSJC255A00]ESX32805.1 hypothetical protein X765_00940 [Mesorhizobium sp. LSHC440B00]ESX33800.1 hypothetical protein X764_29140 [Mesorhizobium sp. LSHC440A00]ESX40128.1 hypothetical protein X763_07470 [Mesorhizobium sp. LSHC432A00]ESY20700.1 hypothetical protein X750_17910 [Mesorhizobium sp. LNJC394B00]ESY34621.1 hypothetical protein X747_29510 [Mesorhizobium sp. LNJC3
MRSTDSWLIRRLAGWLRSAGLVRLRHRWPADDPIHQTGFGLLAGHEFAHQTSRQLAPLTLGHVHLRDQISACSAYDVGIEG